MLRLFGWPDARCYYKPPNILVCRELMEVAVVMEVVIVMEWVEYQQTLALVI